MCYPFSTNFLKQKNIENDWSTKPIKTHHFSTLPESRRHFSTLPESRQSPHMFCYFLPKKQPPPLGGWVGWCVVGLGGWVTGWAGWLGWLGWLLGWLAGQGWYELVSIYPSCAYHYQDGMNHQHNIRRSIQAYMCFNGNPHLCVTLAQSRVSEAGTLS